MKLRNSYFALRHGRSIANEAGIIVSDPARGVAGYGLSEGGRAQLRADLARWRSSGLPFSAHAARCYSSDFLRARQTAELFCTAFGLPSPDLTALLRERSFGELDGGPDGRYDEVWREDERSANHHAFGCESTNDVGARLTEFLAAMEEEGPRVIVAVAHGDTLQILQTCVLGIPTNHHRRLAHLEPGELRCLNP